MRRMRSIDGHPRIVGARCAVCNHATVPLRRVCPACGSSNIEEATFGPVGTVLRWADLQVSTDDVQAPYHVGLVQLREGPIVFTRIEGAPSRGQSVQLRGLPEQDRYWFEIDSTF